MRSNRKSTIDKVTVIGKGCIIENDTISSNDPITFDGNFYGTVKSTSDVYIGIDGYVDGFIDGGSIIIDGKFNGNISNAEHVRIGSSGIVTGDVHTKLITIDEGGALNGMVDMNIGGSENNSTREEE